MNVDCGAIAGVWDGDQGDLEEVFGYTGSTGSE